MYLESLPASILRAIVERVGQDLRTWQEKESQAELAARIRDLPPTKSFSGAITGEFGLIAEIKRKSPSVGPMRNHDVDAIAGTYEKSPVVRAISVLTNADDFGMTLHDLANVRALVSKPLLRKDFIFDPYQVFQARAYGADAILLMANLVTREGLRELSALAESLGLDVLFETHAKSDIAKLPVTAKICGINSRRFTAGKWRSRFDYFMSRLSGTDRSIDLGHFNLIGELPKDVIKIAESGVSPSVVARLRDDLDFDGVLVGTSILRAEAGVESALAEFERAINRRHSVGSPRVDG